MEKTLIVLKPDAVERGIVGEIITRFEKVGLKIVGMKMLSPDNEHYHHHYEGIGKVISRRGQKVFDINLEYMKMGPVIAMVLEGIEAVAIGRKIVGSTESKSAAPGTIRGDFAHMSFAHADTYGISTPNIVHASGDPEEAKQEITFWFSEKELFEYETVHEQWTQMKELKKKK